MAVTSTYGTPIKNNREWLENNISRFATKKDPNPSPDDIDSWRVHAKVSMDAYDARAKGRTDAQERALFAKNDFGNGVSTRFLIYNATSSALNWYGEKTTSGKWTKYQFPNRIEIGEWAVAFHGKTSRTMTGSCGSFAFTFADNEIDLAAHIGFETPYSGDNQLLVQYYERSAFARTSWATMQDKTEEIGVERGTAMPMFASPQLGLTAEYSTDNSSSPTVEIILTNLVRQ